MGFFDNLKEKATDLAQTGVAKSKQQAESAKLKTANMGEEDAIKKAYVEIGKLYYAEKGMAPEGAYAAACEKITAARAAIEANNDRIAELKEATGVDEAEEAVADVVEDVKDAAGNVSEVMADVVEDVKDAVTDLADKVQQPAGQAEEAAQAAAEEAEAAAGEEAGEVKPEE